MERGWRRKLTPFARALVLASVLFQIAICMFLKHEKDDVEAVNFKASLEVDLINV